MHRPCGYRTALSATKRIPSSRHLARNNYAHTFIALNDLWKQPPPKNSSALQITLESFTLGRFVSYTVDGCPDGSLQIAEASRAPVGGMWCGSAWGPVVFYSETRTLILTVKLFK